MADEIARLGLALDSRAFRAEGIAAARTLDDIKRSAEGATTAANTTATALSRVVGQMKSLAAMAGIGLAIREIIQMADQYKLLEGRLRMVTKGNEDLMRTEIALHQMAQRTRSGYAETAELFTKVARNGAQLGKTNEQLMQFTESVQKSIQIGGASAGESSAAVLQLGQALASGVLRGDEFRSIMENASGMAFYLAKGLNVGVGELRRMAMDGKLTADVLLTSFTKMRAQIDEDFKNVPLTVGHAFTIMKNEVFKYIGETDRAHGSTALLSQGIVLLAQNITPLLNALTAVGIVMGARWLAGGITSLVAYTAAQANALKATIAHSAALVTNAQMEESAAVMTHLKALSDERAATAAFLAATGTEAETAALVALSRASALAAETQSAMVLATEAVAVAEAGATVTTGALAAAMGVLKGAMAFLGGPIGIAITAIAAGLYLLWDRYQKLRNERAAARDAEIKEADAIMAGNEALRKQTELMDRKLRAIRDQRTALDTGGQVGLDAVIREQGAVDAARAAWDKYKETTSNNTDKALEFDKAVKAGNANALAFLGMTRTTAKETADLELDKAYKTMNRELLVSISAAGRLNAVRSQEAGVVKDMEATLAAEAKARSLGVNATKEQKSAVVALSLAEYARQQQGEATTKIKNAKDAISDLQEQVIAARDSEAATTDLNTQLEIKNRLEGLSATVGAKARAEIKATAEAQAVLNRTLQLTIAVREAERSAGNAYDVAAASAEGEGAIKRVNEQLEIEGIRRKYGNNLTAEQVELLTREITAIRMRNSANEAGDYNQRTADLEKSTDEIKRQTAAVKEGKEAVRLLNIELAIEAENRGRATKMTPDEERRRREELSRKSEAEVNQARVEKAVADAKAIWENFIRGVQSGIADMINTSLTEGIKGVSGFLDLLKKMIIRMFAELMAMRLMQKLFTPNINDTTVGGGSPIPGGPGFETTPGTSRFFGLSGQRAFGAGLAGLGAGYGAGQALFSTSHGNFGNTTRGALGGAASGAAAGFMVGGPVGAAIGAVAGLAGGILGIGSASREAAKQMAEAVKQVTLSMAALKASVNHDQVAAGIADIEADRAQRAKAIEEAWSGGDANSDRVRWRTQQLKEMNALEDQRIQQLKEEHAQQRKNFAEDLQVRLLVAQGKNKDAERLRLQLAQEREYREAVKNGTDDATLALLRQVQAQEKVAAEANNLTSALLNVPTGFKLRLAEYEAMSGVAMRASTPAGVFSSNVDTTFHPYAPDVTARQGGGTLIIPVALDGKVITKVVVENFEALSSQQNGNSRAWAQKGITV